MTPTSAKNEGQKVEAGAALSAARLPHFCVSKFLPGRTDSSRYRAGPTLRPIETNHTFRGCHALPVSVSRPGLRFPNPYNRLIRNALGTVVLPPPTNSMSVWSELMLVTLPCLPSPRS